MRVWQRFLGVAMVMLACSVVVALGDDTNSNSTGNGNDQVPPSDQVEAPPEEAPAPAAPAAAPATSYGPFMQALEAIGIGKPLESLGFNFHGYIEGGYLYDMTVPKDQTPARTAPGDFIFFPGAYKNSVMLNQADISLEKDMVNLPKGDWDFGFDVEAGWGRDFFWTHSNGILDNHNKEGGTGDDDQFDLLQAYAQLGIPIGTGLTVEAGKFLSLLGYEKIDPTQNMFYTHSYAFSYGEPFTMTGVLGSYTFSDPSSTSYLKLTGGITRGWNQSIYDNNGDIDGVMQVKLHTDSFDWNFGMTIGPEGVLPYGPSDYAHWWWAPDSTFIVRIGDQLSAALDILYGDAPATSQWLSIAPYIQYKLDPHLWFATRFEYYHDGRGFTTGVGGPDINYFEGTIGATLIPMPDSPFLDTFQLRPEIRVDFADHPVFDFTKWNQVTASMDVVYRF
jgi:hypothetical protein